MNLVHTGVIHAILSRAGGEIGDKLHLGHIQLAQLLLHPLLEIVRSLFPRLGKDRAPFCCLFPGLVQLLFQTLDSIVSILYLFQLYFRAFQIVQHIGYSGAILFLQAIDYIQPAFQLIQLFRREVKFIGKIPEGLCRVIGGTAQGSQLLRQFV